MDLSWFQRLGTATGIVLCVAIFTLLLRRGLWRVSYTWTLYVACVGFTDALILGWPHTFWTWGFWTSKELLLAILKFAMGLELGALAFRRFPGAQRTARSTAALTLLGVAIIMALAPRTNQGGLAGLALEAHARLSHGSALLLIALGLLVLWYRVPVHRLHRAVLRGLATYLLLFSGGLRTALSLLDTALLAWWNTVSSAAALAYVVMLAYWLWEVWRRVPDDDVRGSAAIEARLAWRERLGGEKQEARP